MKQATTIYFYRGPYRAAFSGCDSRAVQMVAATGGEASHSGQSLPSRVEKRRREQSVGHPEGPCFGDSNSGEAAVAAAEGGRLPEGILATWRGRNFSTKSPARMQRAGQIMPARSWQAICALRGAFAKKPCQRQKAPRALHCISRAFYFVLGTPAA